MAEEHAGTALVWVAAVAYGLGISALYAGVVSLCQEFTHVSGSAMSLFVVGASLGKMTLPLATSASYDRLGGSSFPVCILALAVADALCLGGLLLVGGKRSSDSASQSKDASVGEWVSGLAA